MHATSEEFERKHLLRGVTITQPWSWERSKKELARPNPLGLLVSIIHNTLNGHHNDAVLKDILCTLLALADRYDIAQHIEIGNPNDYREQGKPSKKHKLSVEAMLILSEHFFAPNSYSHALPYQKPVFATLLWFFRRRGERGESPFSNLFPEYPENLGSKDVVNIHLATLRKFAEEFTLTAWDVVRAWPNADESVRDIVRIIHAHTQVYWREVLELMVQLNLLGYLRENPPRPERFKEMEQEVLQAGLPPLEEGGERRFPRSLREAVEFGGSNVADILWGIRPKVYKD